MIKGINQAARVDQAKRESVKNADKNLMGQKASDQILESDKIAIAKTNSIAKEIEAKAVERIGTMDEAEKLSKEVLPFEEKALQTQGNISKQSAESLIIA